MITAILLAAGESKRIPKENKLLKKFKNKPLVNHILESLIKSKVKKILIKKKKITLVINKDYKKGMSSSIKSGLKKVSKNNKGFMIIQSDMPYIKSSHINKINNSILNKNKLVHALKYKNRRGNPIGFNISVLNKFKKIKGDIGAKYIVKRLKKNTHFINVTSNKIFKDLDLKKDFNYFE